MSLFAPGRTIRNINPQITSAVIPKKIQSATNGVWVTMAEDVITRASDDFSASDGR